MKKTKKRLTRKTEWLENQFNAAIKKTKLSLVSSVCVEDFNPEEREYLVTLKTQTVSPMFVIEDDSLAGFINGLLDYVEFFDFDEYEEEGMNWYEANRFREGLEALHLALWARHH